MANKAVAIWAIFLLCWNWNPLPAAAQQQDAQATAQPRYLSASWSFKDADLSTLTRRMQWVGIELPFTLSGKATANIAVGIPFGYLRDAKRYRFGGTITAKRLVVDDTVLHDAFVKISYREGVLTIEELRFATAEARSQGGTVDASASLQLIPRGDLSIRAGLTDVPVNWLVRIADPNLAVDRGNLSGTLQASVPLSRIRQSAAWNATASFRLRDLRAYTVVLRSGLADFRLANNQLTLTKLQADPGGGELSGTGTVALTVPYPFTSRLRWQNVAANKLLEIIPQEVQGKGSGTLSIEGDLQPAMTRTTGEFHFDELAWNGLTLEKLTARLEPDPDGRLGLVLASNLGAGTLNGRIAQKPKSIGLTLNVQQADLSSIYQHADGGTFNATLTADAPTDSFTDVTTWSGSVEADVLNPQLAGWTVAGLKTQAQLEIGTATLRTLTVTLTDEATLSLQGSVGLDTPHSFQISGDMPTTGIGILKQLAPALNWPADLAGQVRAQVNFTGALEPLRMEGASSVTVADAMVAGVEVPAATFELLAAQQELRISQLAAEFAGGKLTGSGILPFDETKQAHVDLQFQSVDLTAFPVKQIKGVASGSLSVRAKVDQLGDPAKWATDASLRLRGAEIAKVPVPAATLQLRSEQEALQISQLAADIAGGKLTGSGSVPFDETATAKFRLELKDLQLATFAEQAKGQVEGTASLNATVSQMEDLTQWSGDSSLTLHNLEVGQAKLARLGLTGEIAGGAMRARIPATDLNGFAQLTADATLQLTAPYTVTGDLSLSEGDLSKLDSLLNDWTPPQMQGTVVVKGTLSGALAEAGWKFAGQANGSDVAVAGLTLDRLTAQLQADPQQFILQSLQTQLLGGQIRVRAMLPFSEDAAMKADVFAEGLQLADLAIAGIGGRLQGESHLAIPVKSLEDIRQWDVSFRSAIEDARLLDHELANLTASGTFADAVASVDVKGIGSLGDLAATANVARTPQHLQLSSLKVQMLNGVFDGDATLPLQSDADGRLNLDWSGVDPLQFVGSNLSGPASGTLRMTWHGQQEQAQRTASVVTSFEMPTITRGRETIATNFAGRLQLEKQSLQYQASGAILGARTTLEGYWSSQADADIQTSHAHIHGLSLAKASDAFDLGLPLGGTVEFAVDYLHQPDGSVPSATGQLSIRDVDYDNKDLASQLSGRIAYSNGIVELRDFSGRLADGELRLSVRSNLSRPSLGTFQLSLLRMDTRNLAERIPAFKTLQQDLSGTIDLKLRGRLGRQLQAAGVAELARGSLLALGVTNVRFPLNATWDLRSNTGAVRITGFSGHMARGRGSGDVLLSWQPRLTVQTDLRLVNLDAFDVLNAFTESSSLGRGRLNGKLTLSGRDVSRLEDLSGQVTLSLRDTQSASFPVMRALQPYVSPAAGGMNFDTGDLVGQISRGVLRIQKLTLEGRSVQLYVTGDVSSSGRLSLAVVASTGNLASSRSLFQELFLKLPALGAPPVALLMQANEYLSDRVIHLEVTGTLRQPVVRLKPLESLGEEAVRFFLKQSSSAIPSAAVP